MANQPQDDAENSRENSVDPAPWLDPHRWKPGQSGNPGGRPKKKPLTDALIEQLAQEVSEDIRVKMKLKPGATFAEVLAASMVHEAVLGKTKVSAFSEIANRVEGKVTQQIAGPEGGAIPVALTFEEMTDEQLLRIAAGGE